MDTVVGHSAQKETLWQNREVNTWLLCGKRGIGKATLSHAYAKLLTRSDSLDSHPDVAIIDDETSPIGIDKIRKIKHFLHMSPISAERKIVILDSIDGLNSNTINSMLKILEEPPQHSLILIISHNLYSVPIVIRSRCMILSFSQLSLEETRQVIGLKFPDMNLEDKAVALYPGIPGMVSEDIDKEITLYENIIDLIQKKNVSDTIGNVLETELPMHKIEYLSLKAIYDTILSTLRLHESNTNYATEANILAMLDKYSKAQEIFATARKLHIHREATLFRIAEIISNLLKSKK
ncbi:DNA polymerase III subunit tau [Anaplasma phagocytophilum]|uniref:AAA family ATPase n=1 Tax=Anaplasma phagocytophilum TaxID=948 RepID=UPI0007E21B79|nr:AAA family ATPase [Anaplasma phagocytophilum]SCV63924.1 DNA polymerase III subunit tau [Anaplasma phagocytophilum]